MADCDWNSNHRACTNTWGVLFTLKQIRVKFKTAGSRTMDSLAFFNPTASPAQRRQAAQETAQQLDLLLTSPLVGASYERGFTKTSAIGALTDHLAVESHTVCELSLVVDELYRFRSEID